MGITQIFLAIIFITTFYLLGRWLNKDERAAEQERQKYYRLEQEKLKKKVEINRITVEDKKSEHKSLLSILKEYWIVILFFLLPILITLFKYFVLGVRFFGGEGPDQCWGGQSCY